MTTLDDKLVPTAKALLDKFGQVVTFNSVSEAYDRDEGVSTTTTTPRPNIRISPPVPISDKLIDGNLRIMGDSSVFIAASGLGFTPKAKDTVVIGTDTWSVLDVKTYYSGEQIAVYECAIRRTR